MPWQKKRCRKHETRSVTSEPVVSDEPSFLFFRAKSAELPSGRAKKISFLCPRCPQKGKSAKFVSVYASIRSKSILDSSANTPQCVTSRFSVFYIYFFIYLFIYLLFFFGEIGTRHNMPFSLFKLETIQFCPYG